MGRLARIALPAAAASLLIPVLGELRLRRPEQALDEQWQSMSVEPRRGTRLGISYRPRQVAAFGLEDEQTLRALLQYPFDVVRLGAYWNRLEPAPNTFNWDELDRHVDAAEQAGKQIMLCVGALKTFGYPEFFTPAHHLPRPLPEGALIRPAAFGSLIEAACAFITRCVERYRTRAAIVAWQVEHESVDPLGMEHSWRLSIDFVRREVEAVRAADPGRPVLLNGYLPVSWPVRLSQWWQSRDQGDSLSAAQRLADIVGIDYYPRHALVGVGGLTLYLVESGRWHRQRQRELFRWARQPGKRLMVSEGQAEPWEAITTPPSPRGQRSMYSCRPHDVIDNYNRWMRWSRMAHTDLAAYLCWGAEYWMVRARHGDRSYLDAFVRMLERA